MASTQKQLRIDLAYMLTQPLLDQWVMNPTTPGPGRPAANFDRLKGKHFATGAKKGQPRGRCKVCAKQKKANGKFKDTKTANRCDRCNVFLCLGGCFEAYHSKQNF